MHIDSYQIDHVEYEYERNFVKKSCQTIKLSRLILFQYRKNKINLDYSQNFFHIRNQHGQISRNQCAYVNYHYYENFDFSALYIFNRLFYRAAFSSNIVYYDVVYNIYQYEAVANWLTNN